MISSVKIRLSAVRPYQSSSTLLPALARNSFLEDQPKEQGENFFWCEDHPDDARIIALHNGFLFLLKPSGS